MSARAPRQRRRQSEAWESLAAAAHDPVAVDEAQLRGLPDPAVRLLRRALPQGLPLGRTVELEMRGTIRIGSRWWPFRARQVLCAGVGFVWEPVVGGRLVRFVGADVLVPGAGSIDFRLHGLIPVARDEGPDVTRSALGRLAAETVAWVPQALLPEAGASWRAVDDRRATVTVPVAAAGSTTGLDVDVVVDDEGRLTELSLLRWNTSGETPAEEPFGGSFTAERRSDAGVVVAGGGAVGWGWGTPRWGDGEFFRFDVTAVHHPAP